MEKQKCESRRNPGSATCVGITRWNYSKTQLLQKRTEHTLKSTSLKPQKSQEVFLETFLLQQKYHTSCKWSSTAKVIFEFSQWKATHTFCPINCIFPLAPYHPTCVPLQPGLQGSVAADSHLYYFIYAWLHLPCDLASCSTVVLDYYTWPIHNCICIFFFSFKLISANTTAELGSRVTQMPHGWGGQLSSTTIQQFGSSLAVVLTAFLEPSYEPDPLNRNVTHVSKGFEGFGIYERPICRDGNCVIWFCCFGRILL